MRRGYYFLAAAIFFGGFFIFFLPRYFAEGKVLISEVKIGGLSSTDEYVELYNNSSSSADLIGWKLCKYTKSGLEYDLVNPFSAVSLVPFGYLLIAHQDYSGTVTADIKYSSSSLADNNYIYLYDAASAAVDSAGWGSVTTSYRLTQGNPGSTKSLVRKPGDASGNGQDTDDDVGDFFISDSPSPQNRLGPPRPVWPPPPNQPPVAAITSSATSAAAGDSILFDGSDSYDSDGVIASWMWDFGDGGSANTMTSSYQFTATGSFSAILTVTDDNGASASATAAIDILSAPVSSTPICDWSKIKINEFVSDPASGNEWVEIFSLATSSLDLSGGMICDSRDTTSACKALSGTIGAGGWLQLDLLTTSYLNNDGDSVILRSLDGTAVDRVDYSGAYNTDKGESLARKVDGNDADNVGDWAVTTAITPGASNVIVAPVPPSSGGGGAYTPPVTPSPTTTPPEEKPLPASGAILLNEIYPNPPGSDTVDEFIEIKNSSTQAVDLNGWKIGDLVHSYSLTGSISPGQIIFYKREATKISLNNTTKEEVKLINSAGAVADSVTYPSATEGQSFARDAQGLWKWTVEPTPGTENKIVAGSLGGIVWKINAPSSADTGEVVAFDAEDSADERGGELSFNWSFSDGFSQSGGEAEHAFSATGTYNIIVSASSTSGSSGQKKLTIIIGRGLAQSGTGVIISEILANPEGNDNAEFIELFNSGVQDVDLSGWSLKIENGKIHLFADGTVIPAQSYLVFYRAVTGFALNNSDEKIELINRDGEVVDLVKVGKSESGKSYNYSLGEWIWSDMPTPGEINLRPAGALKQGDVIIKSASGKKAIVYNSLSLAEARAAEIGEGVKVKGTVVVLPGIFGSQFFYISDGGSGMQVYQYKKDFPEIKTGDLVEVTGVISEASGVKRIKMANRSAADILSTENPVEPLAIEPQEISEENLGGLVKVTGEITEIKTNYMYLDNGAGEIKVYFKKGASIDKNAFKEGENAEIVGVIEQGAGEFQLWPRSQADISSLGPSEDLLKKQQAAAGNPQDVAEKYLTATAGGLTALILALLARARGVLVLSGLKKAVQVAVGFFKRG